MDVSFVPLPDTPVAGWPRFLSVEFSSSSALGRRESKTSGPPCSAYPWQAVAEPTPCFEHTMAVALPTSCSSRMPMICSSLNLDRFIVRLLVGSGPTSNRRGIRGSGQDPPACSGRRATGAGPYSWPGIGHVRHLAQVGWGDGSSGLEWCCERGLNSRPHPYQGCALPLSYHSADTGGLLQISGGGASSFSTAGPGKSRPILPRYETAQDPPPPGRA